MNEEIDVAIENARDVINLYLGDTPAIRFTNLLVDLLHFCDHTPGLSWQRSVTAARAQYHKEVREAADQKPLPRSIGSQHPA